MRDGGSAKVKILVFVEEGEKGESRALHNDNVGEAIAEGSADVSYQGRVQMERVK